VPSPAPGRCILTASPPEPRYNSPGGSYTPPPARDRRPGGQTTHRGSPGLLWVVAGSLIVRSAPTCGHPTKGPGTTLRLLCPVQVRNDRPLFPDPRPALPPALARSAPPSPPPRSDLDRVAAAPALLSSSHPRTDRRRTVRTSRTPSATGVGAARWLWERWCRSGLVLSRSAGLAEVRRHHSSTRLWSTPIIIGPCALRLLAMNVLIRRTCPRAPLLTASRLTNELPVRD